MQAQLLNMQEAVVRRISVANLLLACAASFAAAYAIASLWLPMGWDHGIMGSVGDAMVRGGLPFVDGWDLKGPTAYVPFAIAEGLSGANMWGIRLVELLILVPALYLMFRLVAAYTTGYLGAWVSLAFYLWFASSGWFFTAQPEIWVTALSVIAIYPFLVPDRDAPDIVTTIGAGVLIGLVALVKPIYIAYGVVPVATAISLWRLSFSLAVRNALLIGIGAAIPLLATAAYLAAFGGLDEAINVHMRYTSSVYLSSLDPKYFVFAVIEAVSQGSVAVSVPFVVVGLWSLRRNERLLVPMVIWLALTFFFVFVQAKAFTYHWFPIYAPYLILAAFGVDTLWRSASGSLPTRIAVMGAAAMFFAHVGTVPLRELYRFAADAAGGFSSQAHFDRYRFRAYSAGDQYRAANYIREHSQPSDGVFVWGVDATVRLLSGRANVTRFFCNMALTMESPFRAEYRAEVMQELSERPPEYIVVGLPWEMDEKKGSFFAFKEFHDFVARGYTLDQTFGMLDLYRRNKP